MNDSSLLCEMMLKNKAAFDTQKGANLGLKCDDAFGGRAPPDP